MPCQSFHQSIILSTFSLIQKNIFPPFGARAVIEDSRGATLPRADGSLGVETYVSYFSSYTAPTATPRLILPQLGARFELAVLHAFAFYLCETDSLPYVHISVTQGLIGHRAL